MYIYIYIYIDHPGVPMALVTVKTTTALGADILIGCNQAKLGLLMTERLCLATGA